MLTVLFAGCKEQGADVRPGIYLSSELIDAFPCKQVNIAGQASCFTGLQSLTITCEAWKLSEVQDLSSQHPVVWNFDYTFDVPADASFPAEMLVTATDVHGTEMKKAVTMRYTPATTAPYIDGLQKQIAIEYDESAGQGELVLKATLYGEDVLKQVVIDIPDEDIHETISLNHREEQLLFSHVFTALGSFPLTITLSDNSGNVTVAEHKLIVMKPEVLDEPDDYPQMYVFKSNTNEADYIYGFYQYVNRQDAYQYQVMVYAETDETAFLFTPSWETDGERLFGESPLVEERLISVQSQPGYVQGYKPGKGYWGLWIDLRECVIKKWALDTSEADKSLIYYSADWNSWSFTPMQAGETAYQQVADITIYAGNQYFCFATATDWTHIWRIWNTDDGNLAGWWFSEDGTGSGATLPTITADTEATISFDTAIKWCYIIKK